jgi:hypothetical protein
MKCFNSHRFPMCVQTGREPPCALNAVLIFFFLCVIFVLFGCNPGENLLLRYLQVPCMNRREPSSCPHQQYLNLEITSVTSSACSGENFWQACFSMLQTGENLRYEKFLIISCFLITVHLVWLLYFWMYVVNECSEFGRECVCVNVTVTACKILRLVLSIKMKWNETYPSKARPDRRRRWPIRLQQISAMAAETLFFQRRMVLGLALTVFKSFFYHLATFLLWKQISPVHPSSLPNSAMAKNCVAEHSYLLRFVHHHRYWSFCERLLASLSSSGLQQEAWESALHGVTVHPVFNEKV